ncbi:MAG TPA: hypothetical protein VL961_08335 [Acidimicrobiales bacterium]|nr:hypothetical protein [Acidimicrobiales bacterium]
MASGDIAALEEVAEAAETTAREQSDVATTARRMAAQRSEGRSWRDMTRHSAPPGGAGPQRLATTLEAGWQRIRRVASLFRRVAMRGLADEGVSTREIGKTFGVSHQRVSAIVTHRDTP